jgi:hypothetical protein
MALVGGHDVCEVSSEKDHVAFGFTPLPYSTSKMLSPTWSGGILETKQLNPETEEHPQEKPKQ